MALTRQTDTILVNDTGRAYPGVRVQAYVGNVGQQLYSDDQGTETDLIETDVNGLYDFWIEEGDYRLEFSVSGIALGDGEYSIFEKANLSYVNLLDQPNPDGYWDGWNTVDFPPPAHLDGTTQRLRKRLFVDAATATSGDFPAAEKDYYEQFEADHTSEFGFRTSWASFASGSSVGGIGVLGFARTSDTAIDVPFQLGVGGWFATINDSLDNPCLATGLYGVAFRMPGAGQGLTGVGTVGGEVDVCNLGNSVQVTPGNLYPSTGFTTGWQVNSGAYVDEAQTASAGITIGNNKADWFAGIVIAKNALAGLTFDGGGTANGGYASAIRLNTYQHMEWWTNPYVTPSFTISSEQSSANRMSIIASDTGILMGGPSGEGLAFQTLYPGGATGAWLYAMPANGSSPPTLGVTGGGANQNLRLVPKGTGTVSFGTYVATPTAVIGYITIADDAGVPRKLAVIS